MAVIQIRSQDGTGTLSYLLVDENKSVGCLIDPNIEDLPMIESMIADRHLRVTHIVDTHTHADHVSAAGKLREKTGAQTVMHSNTKNKWKVVHQGDAFGIGDTLRANAAIVIDRYVEDGEIVQVGSLAIKILFTPGHTDNHVSLLVDDNLFTGDLLLIGQAGRSDLPGGNPQEQYDSLFNKVLALPDKTKIYPGHDYQDLEFAWLGDERKSNPFLQRRTKQEFVEFVKDFFPPVAENVASGGKMTLQCGVQRIVQSGQNITSITPGELNVMIENGDKPFLLDVREPIELEMNGAIQGVRNISINVLKDRRDVIPQDKSQKIVCVCQGGGRSLEAAYTLTQLGYKNVLNLTGGTSGWIQSGFPVVRSKQPV